MTAWLRAPNVRTIVLAGVLATAAAYSHLLTLVHRELATTPHEPSVGCGLGGRFDCSGSMTSDYGRLLGLPISAYASAWFLFMLGMLVTGVLRRHEGKVLHRALLAASLPAVAAVLFYAFVSAVILRSFCLYCLGTYLIVALIALLAVRGAELDWAPLRRHACVAAWWSVPVLMFGAAIAYARWSVRPDSDSTAGPASTALASVPRLGPRTAPMKLVLFTAFECPACRTGAKELERFRNLHPDEVELQVVTIPLHGFPALLKDEPVPIANYLPAALGLVMHRRGRFWEYYREVFHGERKVDEQFLWDVIARIAGPREIPAIARELEQPATISALRRQAAIARLNNVTSTPTYLIDGKREVGPLKAGELKARLGAARSLPQHGPPPRTAGGP